MTKVFVHGKLGKIFGEYHEFQIEKKLDVIKAIDANKGGFRQFILSEFKNDINYDLIDPQNPDKKWDTIEEYLNEPAPNELHIIPSISGEAGLGFVFSVITTVVSTATALVGAVGSFLTAGSFLGNIAMGIIINGIQMLLFPQPKGPAAQKQESKVDQSSYLFSSLENNVVQGFAIPLLYGELRVGSNVISVNILNEDLG